jgi:hypothetical protein
MGNCILQAYQAFVHVENNAVDMERNMTFQQGVSGNPHGNRHRTRHLLNQRFLQALLLDFEAHGREAIEQCRKQSPLGYVKVLGHLVPREMQIEHSQSLKSMSDEELEATIEYVRAMLAAHAGNDAKVINGGGELAALPAPADVEGPPAHASEPAAGARRRRGRAAGAQEAQGAIATCRVTSACGRCVIR